MELNGKTVYFLGSSVTYGSAAGGRSFAELLCEKHGCRMIKEAENGTTLADIGERSYPARLEAREVEGPVDLFVCQLSTNDANPARHIRPADTEAGLRRVLTFVQRRWGCPVLIFTGTRYANPRYADMVRSLHALRAEYGFAVLDLFNDADMLATPFSLVSGYMQDMVHPLPAGYAEWWLPKFEAAIKQL